MIVDHVSPGMQRILVRLGETPVSVFSADWRLIWWNQSWAGLLGDPRRLPVGDRSLVCSRFPVPGDGGSLALWPVISENVEQTDRAVVADLRRAAGRYPNDPRLTKLIQARLSGNERFAELWRGGGVAGHREDRKVIRHPEIGDITVDCDVLNDSDTDLKLVVYTAAPGSEDETKLQLARVVGAQAAKVR